MEYYGHLKAFLESIEHTEPELIAKIKNAAALIFEGQEYLAEGWLGDDTAELLEKNVPKIMQNPEALNEFDKITRNYARTLLQSGSNEDQLGIVMDELKPVIDDKFDDRAYLAWFFTAKLVMDMNRSTSRIVIDKMANSDIEDISDILAYAKKSTVSDAWKA